MPINRSSLTEIFRWDCFVVTYKTQSRAVGVIQVLYKKQKVIINGPIVAATLTATLKRPQPGRYRRRRPNSTANRQHCRRSYGDNGDDVKCQSSRSVIDDQSMAEGQIRVLPNRTVQRTERIGVNSVRFLGDAYFA